MIGSDISLQEMLIEKYLFTKAPAGPHHSPNWSCIDCKNKLEGEYDFYPYCISCKENRHKRLHACYYYKKDEDGDCENIEKYKEWVVRQKGMRT